MESLGACPAGVINKTPNGQLFLMFVGLVAIISYTTLLRCPGCHTTIGPYLLL